jgi:hypothetical protein
MAGLEQDPSATEAALRADRAGSTMITIGWILIGFDCVSAVFLWVGLRSGSLFWVWWVIAEGVAALILIWLGGRKKMQARSLAENANRR